MKLPPKSTLVSLAAGVLAASSLSLTSCQTAGEGALTGAAIGAVGGAIIGNQSGDAGKGALLGGAAGAAAGGLIGNENQKRNRAYYYRNGQRYQDPRYQNSRSYRGPATYPTRNAPYQY